MSKFKVGDRVKALTNGGYTGVCKAKDTGIVTKVYPHDVSEVLWNNNLQFRVQERGNIKGWPFRDCEIELVIEPKYPIIEMLHGDKIVFNPPYTIVTCNLTRGPFKGQKLIGKAKCNPLDTYDKWTGFKIAHDRMAKAAPCTK